MKVQMKNFMFTSIIIIIIVTLSFVLLYVVMPEYYEQKKRNELTELVDNIGANLNGKSLDEIFEFLNGEMFKSETFLELVDKDNQIIYPNMTNYSVVTAKDSSNKGILVVPNESDGLLKSEKDATTSSKERVARSQTYSVGINSSLQERKIIKDDKGDSYSINGTKSLQPIDESAEVLLNIYPWILLTSFFVGGVGAFFYSCYSSKRIRNISNTTKKMIGMDPTAVCVTKGGDEVSELAKDINYLYKFLFQIIAKLNIELEAKSDIERSKAEFLRIASHELKTPVTAMMGIIEGMQYNVGDFKDHDHYLAVCKEMLESQSQLIKDILYVSKIDMLEISSGRETISIKELLKEEILPLFELMAKTKIVQIDYDLEDVMIIAVKEDLKRVLINLFSNAINYTKKNGKIQITLNSEYFSLSNQCQPLTEEELTKVFTAFYRPDYARSRKDGGTGLGLFIVAQLLERNYLSYDFKSTILNDGMIFKILW